MTTGVSSSSRRVARNTALLYVRMLLLMLIGLFTSRVVLKALGVEDYGTYNVTYSIIMMFSLLSNSIGTSIGRFIAYEIGSGDKEKIKRVFSSAIFIQTGLVILLFLLAETVGLWYLNEKVNIPEGRESAAFWVFQVSAVMLAIQLLSTPFNCTIIAHEDMKAFAWVSIVEGILKLTIAIFLIHTSWDKLIVYATLMMSVALIIRLIYAFYCKKHFEETCGKLVWDKGTIIAMLKFGGWSTAAYGVGVFNTQGVNLISNTAFGVQINAVRGIAGQVENIVKQFVANFLTALNPLITKTWAHGNKEYCFALVRKGCKFSYLIILLFLVPFVFEADFILGLWLGSVPKETCLFTVLTIACVMFDMMSNSLGQLIVSNGKVAKYYSIITIITSFSFLGTWTAFKYGYPPETCYYIQALIFSIVAVTRIYLAHNICGFTIKPFLIEVVVPLLATTVLAFAISWMAKLFYNGTEGMWKSLICIAIGITVTAICSFSIALTKGERSFILNQIKSRLTNT